MSFSAAVKAELAALPPGKACCRLAEMAGIALAAGSMRLSGGLVQAEIVTESLAIARRVCKLLNTLYSVRPQLERHERHRLGRSFSYRVVLGSGAAEKFLNDIGGGFAASEIQPELVRLSCCRGAFARGLFLGAGTMSDPGKGYHLEIALEDADSASASASLLAGEEIAAKIADRTGRHVLYLKEADQISGFLALAGAHTAVLKFEGVRVEKGVRNSVNRVVNCDTANLEKAVRAAMRQIQDIRAIERAGQFAGLPRELKEAAEARMQNPDMSLTRLAEWMGGVSKSGLNHRFVRIAGIAREIRLREGLHDAAQETDDPER